VLTSCSTANRRKEAREAAEEEEGRRPTQRRRARDAKLRWKWTRRIAEQRTRAQSRQME
jgi:hypothetical protein